MPAVYFPSLRMGKGNFRKVLPLIMGEEVQYQGAAWLTPPPVRKFSGIPIGGNLTTFVNFLNRKDPPKFNWKRHILFFEDVQIDVEDLHRLLAALRRHRVFKDIRAIVVGSLSRARAEPQRPEGPEGSLEVRPDLSRRRHPSEAESRAVPCPSWPSPISATTSSATSWPCPVGGYVSISKSRKIVFRMHKPRRPAAA